MKIVSLNGELAWAIVAFHVLQNESFHSVTNITYQARVDDDLIIYKGGNRNNGEEEPISKGDFITGFEAIKNLEEINTNAIKELLPNAIYRKRTPFIGLLLSAGIIK